MNSKGSLSTQKYNATQKVLNNCQGLFVRNSREERDEGNERFQACKVVLLPEDLRKILKVQLPLNTKDLKDLEARGWRWGLPSLEEDVGQHHSQRDLGAGGWGAC